MSWFRVHRMAVGLGCCLCLVLVTGGGCAETPRDDEDVGSDPSIDLRPQLELASFLPRGGGGRAPVAFNDVASIITIAASGTLVAPLRIDGADPRLEFDLRFRGSADAREGQVSLAIVDRDGQSWRIGRLESLGEEWTPTALSLAGVPARFPSFLVLEVALPRPAISLEIRNPRLRVDPPPASGTPSARRKLDPPPDVVVIVLDAARASNFGVYGYPRETTPEIDALGHEGLVFRRAFSECPNTSCSMPNLISGIEFVEVGPAGRWHRLDDRMTTLAEYLGRVGYRTVALSASPNNGMARNNHQGFDEFHELWRWPGHERNHPERTDPHRLTRLALEAVDRQSSEDPLFLALHYIPPHEPYHPKPEFDLFGDPGYDGPIVPGTMFRGQVARPDDDADLARMISLYDGNLRMADDAVGKLVDGLRERERWQNTVILVTSDHGEAFFEHGRHGHNDTLFDEMLHVPFILRLPGGERRPDVDTDRLVILSDVVPTILGLLNETPDETVGGIDLLHSPPSSHDRAIFHRHTDGRQFAVHTRKWKAILAPTEQRPPMLFDLEADPGEQENLVDDRPLVFHGLSSLLRGHLLESQQQRFDTTEVELPESDIRALRSLGYLR